MASEELLSSFNELLEEYEKHRHYIERAKAQAQKFSSSVVEKVILDHEVHSSEVADQILPLVPQIESGIGTIDDEKAEIGTSTAAAEAQLEELQLRQLIGELTEKEFDELAKELKDTVEKAAVRVAELDAERETLTGAIERWVSAATEAGQASGVATGTEPEPEPDDEGVVEEGLHFPDEPLVEDASNVHSNVDMAAIDDVSEVFDDEPSGASVAVAVAPSGGGQDEMIDMASADGEEVGDEPSADVDFGFDEDQGGVEFIESGAGDEVEFDVDSEGGGSEDEIGVDLEDEAGDAEEGASAEEDARRALLLYQEGTAEEQIYPFTGDILSVGRGRDNDIQIKNDSKVSRFHCKLFRRGTNFYIEDNKSSNGTLVNGELITERRLFGGEEIIIGETFFRFRIM